MLAVFSRTPASRSTLETIRAIADMLAQAVQRVHGRTTVRQNDACLTEAQRLRHSGPISARSTTLRRLNPQSRFSGPLCSLSSVNEKSWPGRTGRLTSKGSPLVTARSRQVAPGQVMRRLSAFPGRPVNISLPPARSVAEGGRSSEPVQGTILALRRCSVRSGDLKAAPFPPNTRTASILGTASRIHSPRPSVQRRFGDYRLGHFHAGLTRHGERWESGSRQRPDGSNGCEAPVAMYDRLLAHGDGAPSSWAPRCLCRAPRRVRPARTGLHGAIRARSLAFSWSAPGARG